MMEPEDVQRLAEEGIERLIAERKTKFNHLLNTNQITRPLSYHLESERQIKEVCDQFNLNYSTYVKEYYKQAYEKRKES